MMIDCIDALNRVQYIRNTSNLVNYFPFDIRLLKSNFNEIYCPQEQYLNGTLPSGDEKQLKPVLMDIKIHIDETAENNHTINRLLVI